MTRKAFLLPAAFALTSSIIAQAQPAKIEELYQLHCAACHGDQFQGGMGGNLVDADWKHGGTDQEIFDSIAVGNPDLGMTPFLGTLTEKEIRAMVVYVRERENEQQLSKLELPKPEQGKVSKTQHHSYRTELVAKGLEIPWGLAFLPDGRYIVAERPGTLRIIEKDGTLNDPVKNTPGVVHRGQGGLMEVALHPEYESNGWVYLGYSDGVSEPKVATLTAIVRGRIQDNTWQDEETIWRGDKKFYTSGGVHFGTRIVFQDGYLFFGIGDRGAQPEAQNLASPNGNIFRLHDDGRIPEDNPFVGRDDALPEIWSYGHRNPQGLVIHPGTGDIYSTEHGPRGGDEFNLIQRAKNYGWPVITYGMNYNGTPITAETHREGMEQPLVQWTPSIAACGLGVITGKAFPNWENDIFAGGLRSEEVRRLRVKDQKVVEEEIVVKGAGRVRDVRGGPDGFLYIVLNDPNEIIRLVPAE